MKQKVWLSADNLFVFCVSAVSEEVLPIHDFSQHTLAPFPV